MDFKRADKCRSKEEIREQIDRVDARLIELFAERYGYVKEITKFKENTADEIIASERRQKVISQRSEWAEKLGLDRAFFADLFTQLIEHNTKLEFEILDNKVKSNTRDV